MPREKGLAEESNVLNLDNRVIWEVREPMTRLAMAKVLEVCEDALIPDHATLHIAHWPNKEGFSVEARWTTGVPE